MRTGPAATSVISTAVCAVETTFVSSRRLASASYPAAVDLRQLRETVEAVIDGGS